MRRKNTGKGNDRRNQESREGADGKHTGNIAMLIRPMQDGRGGKIRLVRSKRKRVGRQNTKNHQNPQITHT